MSPRLSAVGAMVALVVMVAACSPEESIDATSQPTATATTSEQEGPDPSTSAPSTAPPTTLPPGTEELPEEVRTQLSELISLTEEVRELEFLEQPDVVVVTSEELAERVRSQLEEDLEDLPADEALYDLLGLIEGGTDLAGLYTDLYSEQVAGFYDGEAGELVVPIAAEGFTALQKATLVHELTHALTDQHYGFHERYVEMLDNDRYDEASAYQALIEGDAVLTEFLYLRGLTADEQGEFFAEALGIDSTNFDAAPRFIRDALLFPYDTGFIFVDLIHQSGGFPAVGAAYQSPPTSTEQIIDPNDYPADAPIVVDTPAIVLDGYEMEYESTWGELGFTLLFDQFLSAGTSASGAGGWGGDSYQLLYDGTDVVLALAYRGDTAGDADELASALREYVVAAMDVGEEGSETEGGISFTGEDQAWVRVSGSEVYFVASSAADPFPDVIAQIIAGVPDTTETSGG